MDETGAAAEETPEIVEPDLPSWAEPSGSSPGRTRMIRLGLVVLVVVLAAIWAFAFYAGGRPLADKMDDPAIAAQAEQICSVAVAANKELPPAYEMNSAGQRADVLERSDVTLATMVDGLDRLVPTSDRDIGMWDKWIGDWRTYLSDRDGFIQRLRDDPNARFYVTEKNKDQVTEPIDRFSRSNQMLSCATPQDHG